MSVQRLGVQSDGRCRAVKVRMCDTDVKHGALQKAKFLAGVAEFSKVYIKPDLTPMQLKKRQALSEALKIANANGKRMMIQRGKLVPIPSGQTRQGGPPRPPPE